MNRYIRIIKKLSLPSGLIIVGLVTALFLCDWGLGFLGFPSEAPRRIFHPVNYEEVRKTIEFQYIFKTNNRGLRYRHLPEEKPKNSNRVFVSGDSFTEGVGVDEGKRFTDLLENQFQSSDARVSFINGGLAGTGPLHYGNLFLEVGLEYDSDALLICLSVNDVANTPLKESWSRFPLSSLPRRSGLKKFIYTLWPHLYSQLKLFYSQRDYHHKTKTTNFISTISKEAQKQHITRSEINQWKTSLPQELVSAINQGLFNGWILSYGLLYPEYWSDSIDLTSTRAQKKWRTMKNVLASILDRALQSGVETAIILLPCEFQYDPKAHSDTNLWIIAGSKIRKEWLWEETEIQKRMRSWASSKRVPFLDLTPVFREAIQSNKKLYWELDGHWNHRGHQVAANAIGSWLEDQQIFSFIKKKNLTK